MIIHTYFPKKLPIGWGKKCYMGNNFFLGGGYKSIHISSFKYLAKLIHKTLFFFFFFPFIYLFIFWFSYLLFLYAYISLNTITLFHLNIIFKSYSNFQIYLAQPNAATMQQSPYWQSSSPPTSKSSLGLCLSAPTLTSIWDRELNLSPTNGSSLTRWITSRLLMRVFKVGFWFEVSFWSGLFYGFLQVGGSFQIWYESQLLRKR